MYKYLILMLKGLIIGIGKVIPGVSGSLIALSLGLYERGINAIDNFFKDIKNNLIFLGTVGIGILFSIIIGSKLIDYFLVKNYFCTMFLFIGLILGTIPNLRKKVILKYKFDYFLILFIITSMFIIEFISSNNIYTFNNTLFDYIYIIFIGFIDAATMIIPGISGTAIFIMMGVYNFILDLFSNIYINLNILFFFGLGILIGIILITKFINYLFNKHNKITYQIILGFAISSVLILFTETIMKLNNINNIIFYILFILLGYKIGKKFDD